MIKFLKLLGMSLDTGEDMARLISREPRRRNPLLCFRMTRHSYFRGSRFSDQCSSVPCSASIKLLFNLVLIACQERYSKHSVLQIRLKNGRVVQKRWRLLPGRSRGDRRSSRKKSRRMLLKELQVMEKRQFLKIGYALITAKTQLKFYFVQ